MANPGNFTITVASIPVTPGNDQSDRGARAIVNTLLAQAAQALGSGTATSGNLTYPPGADRQVLGTWTYTPPS